MKYALILIATIAAAVWGATELATGCAAIEKADPAATYPTASGYCALTCKNGCCPYGGADDGWICPDPIDTTKAVCVFNGPVGPDLLKLDAGRDAR